MRERDAGPVHPPHGVGQDHRAGLADRERDPSRRVVHGGSARADGHQLADRRRHRGPVGHLELEHLASHPVLQLVGRSLLDDQAVIDDHDAVGQLVCFLHVLRREQQGGPVGHEFADDLPQVQAASRVESRRGLVQEQHRRPPHQARRQVEPAAHPSRVRLHLAMASLRKPEPLEELAGPAARFDLADVVQQSDQLEVFPAGQVLVDGGVLPGEADDRTQGCGVADHVVPGHLGPALVGLQEGGEDANGRGLAGAVRPTGRESCRGPPRD